MAPSKLTNLTPDQQQAITLEANPLVVRAGAGSGKTRVLVERYLRLVLVENVPMQHILAVTFTDKAAAELKARLSTALWEARQFDRLAELNAAPIGTLHSFCARFIAPYTLTLGLDPGFRILDETEARLIQEETLMTVLSRWRHDHAASLQLLAERLDWSGDYNLRPGRPPASRGFSSQFLGLVEAVRCAGSVSSEPFIPLATNSATIQKKAREILSGLNAALTVGVGRSNKSLDQAVIAQKLLQDLLALSDFSQPQVLTLAGELEEVQKAFRQNDLKLLKRPITEELIPAIYDLYYQPVYEALRQPLNHLFTDFLHAYRDRKFQSGVLDFHDLEELALNVLQNEDVRVPFTHLLVDEAQDLNPMQWTIIRRLRSRAALFAVGDVQQSIYGFRHAEPKYFADLAAQARQGEGQEILLQKNFRSRRAILEVVNGLFERLWEGDKAIPFLQLSDGFPYPPDPSNDVELLLASAPDREHAREREAQFLVQRIAELVKGGSFPVHKLKSRDGQAPELLPCPPQWQDVLILVRSTGSMEPLERALKEQQIPFLIQAGRGFWDALEISDLLALLRSLEDPGDSFSLACVLQSPAVGFSDDDLVELRFPTASDPSKTESRTFAQSLYTGLTNQSDSSAPLGSLPFRSALFLKLFRRLLSLKDRQPLRALLQIWIQETGLEGIWDTHPQGVQVRNNVTKFLQIVDKMALQPLTKLRGALEDIRLRDLREGAAPSLQEGEGAVRVMTVHAAKGLEAPLVALFNLNYQPRRGNAAFLSAPNVGAAFCLTDFTGEEQTFEPQHYTRLTALAKEREEQENQRLLYVAMTRAREKLILSASYTESPRSKVEGWFELLATRLNLKKETIQSPELLPSGPLFLPRKDGTAAQLSLKRFDPHVPLVVWQIPSISTTPVLPPIGFPAAPLPGNEPISVLKFLGDQGHYPLEVQPTEEGELIPVETPTSRIAMGRWVHRVLEVLDWNSPSERWAEEAKREALLLFGRPPTAEELEEVNRLITNFWASSLAREARQARSIVREYSLLFKYQDALLVGKLDLAYLTPSGWVLVDYKSDRSLPPDRLAVYFKQLSLYAQGWQSVTGYPPAKVFLFALSASQIFEVPQAGMI